MSEDKKWRSIQFEKAEVQVELLCVCVGGGEV